jgi:rifampicin phosphotransferase
VTHTLRLADCTAERAHLAGGKAVGLWRLLSQAYDVPPGFVITTAAYRGWLAARRIDLVRPLAGESASEEIRALFERAGPSDDLAAAVGPAYAALGEGPVAVRSSATAEDTPDASFAGQQESYLGVVGLHAVLANVVRCWASLFTPQAISYRERLGVPHDQVAMAVLVQRMVAAEASGVMLTIDPVTGDRSQITIESVHGLGPPLVGGELTPDRHAVDKVTMEVRSRSIARKSFAERLDPSGGALHRHELGEEEAGATSLAEGEVLAVAAAGKAIERALGVPVDVEWALGPGPSGPRHLYLLQARPETVWSGRRAAPVSEAGTTAVDRMVSLLVPRTRSVTNPERKD